MTETSKGIIVKEYLRKMPSVSSKKISEALHSEYPEVFKNPEDARTIIRYYRGSLGDDNRGKLNPETYIPRFSAPVTEEKEKSPYIIPDDAYPIVMAGDVHVPYHDQDALEIFIEYAAQVGAKTLGMWGDWLDFYMLSRFMKDPRKRSLNAEIELFNSILDEIKKALPDTKLIFKMGNHEFRLNSYLMNNAPALYGLEEIKLENLLRLHDRGIDYVDHMQVARFRHLNIIHGHEYVFAISNPVNPARGLYNRAKKNAICFHHHQSSEHTETDITGDVTTCWSAGCLCNLRPDYLPLNKWNHGFIEITAQDEMFLVRNRKIINYKVV